MLSTQRILLLAIGINLHILHSYAWLAQDQPRLIYACYGSRLEISNCTEHNGYQGIINIKSVSVLTNSDTRRITEEKTATCGELEECRRTIHGMEDTGISPGYRHLYQWIVSRCHGKPSCDPTNGTLPEWWDLIDDSDKCNISTKYFAGVLIHRECGVAEAPLETVPTPQPTKARTRPTTPTTTTPFPVFVRIYQPDLEGREKVILGVAIGLALAILLVLLIVLYCCERYRNHRKLGKLLRRLGAPQKQEDAFDELEYGKKDAWKDETQNLDALGEYTGVKPNEFLTLDKHAMEQSGQIMYDTATGTMGGKGNSCSTTLDRLDRKYSPGVMLQAGYNHQGPTDYNTEENVELERRMAAALNNGTEEDTSFQ